MIYTEVMPASIFRNLVQCYWFYENQGLDDINYTIIPDGCFDLIITFDQELTTASLTGLWTRQVEVTLPARIKMAAIRFKPLAAEYLLNTSISSLISSERVEDLSDWKLTTIDWNCREQLVKSFDAALMERMCSVKETDKRTAALFEMLEDTHGSLKVEQYSNSVHWTSRQINRYFNQRFGLSLKTYCGILRCFAACREMQNANLFPPGPYYDQSHLIKDVQRFTGNRPALLQKNKNDRFLQLAARDSK